MIDENSFILELARRARLERGGFDMKDEYGVALYSAWKLLNIKNFQKRKNLVTNIPKVLEFYGIHKTDSQYETDESEEIKFTAHAHKCGIMEQSPDDIALYLLIEDISAVNIITDDFYFTIL